MFKKCKPILQFISLLFVDLLAFYLSLSLSYFIRAYIIPIIFKNLQYFGNKLFPLMGNVWITLVFIFFNLLEGLYTKRYPFWEESKLIFKSTTYSVLFIFFIVSIINLYGFYSRLIFLFLWFFSFIIFTIFRFFGKILLYDIGIWKEDVLFVGANQFGYEVIKGLSNDKHLGYNIIGILDKNKEMIDNEVLINNKKYKIIGLVDDYLEIIKKYNTKTLVIISDLIPHKQLSEITFNLKNVLLIPNMKGLSILNNELQFLFLEELFLFHINNNLNSITNTLIKNIFDFIFSLILIPFYLLIIAIISIIIKIESKGPIFLVEKKFGKNGKIFNCYKFRINKIDIESIDNEDGENITKFGKFLKKFSLDELPQIINVLKGEMSIVGPKPYNITDDDILKNYKEIVLFTKPGITGLWQISGKEELDFDSRINLDIWYIQNWTLWLDIIIIFKTIKLIFIKIFSNCK